MFSRNLWNPQNSDQNSSDFKREFDSSILKEFGPQSNSKCFTDEKRLEYIEKLLSADMCRELPKPLRGFCLGDGNNYWDQAEWRFKANTAEKIHLWTKKTFSSSAKNLGVIRRIVVLEEFFDLIKSHHERPNKDGFNGQKKLFNLIKNRYACLPRDAVDKYITMWRKATSQVSPTDNNNSSLCELDSDGINRPNQSRSITMQVVDNNLSKTTVLTTTTEAEITAVTGTMPTSAMFTEDVRNKKRNSSHTGSANLTFGDSVNKFSGISMVYQPQVTSELKLLANHSPLLNIKYQINNGDNRLADLLSDNLFSKQDCDSSNQDSSKENSFENEDLIPNKRLRLDEGYSETNTDNEEMNDDIISNINGEQDSRNIGLKRPSDIDMAYNIFVRKIIDSTLDRTITFCEQPKFIILGLENICANAFPLFEKSRHRIKIRGYLKACRRNSKKHNGTVSMKDTPSHMCSDRAYSLANEALLKVDNDLQRLIVQRPGVSELNQLNIAKPAETEGSKTDANCSKYMDSVMSCGHLDLAASPSAPMSSSSAVAAAAWSDSREQFSSVLANFLPSLYGMIPLPPVLTPTIVGGASTTETSDGPQSLPPPPPPAAHCNQYRNSLPGSLFTVTDGYSHYSATSHLLEKMLHCTSIDPDFGMELIVNRSASQEAINCMRVTARYLLSRSVMLESYLSNGMSSNSHDIVTD